MFLQNVIIRPAATRGHRRRIAELVYGTDPYIYPFWLRHSSDPISDLAEMIDDRRSIFYWPNIHLAIHRPDAEVVGILIAPQPTQQLCLYERAGQAEHNYVMKNYIAHLLDQLHAASSDTIIFSNLCVAPSARGQGVGRKLLVDTMNQMRQNGCQRFELDCLAENHPALSLYRQAGFTIIGDSFGFADPDAPPPQIYHLAC